MKELTSEQVSELTESYSLFLHDYRTDSSGALIHPLAYQHADGDRLIHVAAIRGDLRTVEWLLNAGENVNAVGDMGDTPAHYAAANLHRNVYDLLVDRGADLAIENEFGHTPPMTWALFEELESKQS